MQVLLQGHAGNNIPPKHFWGINYGSNITKQVSGTSRGTLPIVKAVKQHWKQGGVFSSHQVIWDVSLFEILQVFISFFLILCLSANVHNLLPIAVQQKAQ